MHEIQIDCQESTVQSKHIFSPFLNQRHCHLESPTAPLSCKSQEDLTNRSRIYRFQMLTEGTAEWSMAGFCSFVCWAQGKYFLIKCSELGYQRVSVRNPCKAHTKDEKANLVLSGDSFLRLARGQVERRCPFQYEWICVAFTVVAEGKHRQILITWNTLHHCWSYHWAKWGSHAGSQFWVRHERRANCKQFIMNRLLWAEKGSDCLGSLCLIYWNNWIHLGLRM